MSTPASAEELAELGEALGITSDQVRVILNQTEARQVVILAIDRAWRIDEARLLQKVIETEESEVAELADVMKELDCLDLFGLVAQLADAQERTVLGKLYQDSLDYHQVADELGISVEQVIAAERVGVSNLSELYYGEGTLSLRTAD